MTAEVASRDPFTGEEVFRTPVAEADDISEVIGAAAAGGERWALTPVGERAATLMRFADLVEDDASVLSELIVREVGKRRADAEAEVAWTVRSARWYAEHPPVEEMAAGARVVRRPLGLIVAITPWNVPLVTPAWKWLPALMAGNAVVWKPSELATGVAVAAHRRLLNAGVPGDVLALVPGHAATARTLCADPRVAGIHFTGSEHAGHEVAQLAAPRSARCALEMSGLNPAVVFADADLDLAADCIVACGTALAGQKCTSTRQVFVAQPALDPLTRRLAARIEALRVGDPRDPATDVGPLITPTARAEAEARLQAALDGGARLIARAAAPDGDALFAPALLAQPAPDDSLRTRELFAPVLTIEAFAAPEQAWHLANASPYGLSAAVYGRDPTLLGAAAARIQAGVVAINRRADAVDLEAPFGGHKRSGNGVPEGGAYAYAAVTDLQAVYG
jgi:acyl-CoA reductase-like NAD-dependent aldehyde dehydrogenase